MIAQSLKANSFAETVKYVMKKDAEVLKADGVMALSTKTMIESFELQRSVRPEIKSPVGHITMSYAPEDRERMTDDFMVQLAEEYMEKMNFRNTQYIIVRHHDNANEHCHIVYNRIDNDGKLISLHNDYKRNEQASKALKDKYCLTYGKDKSRVKVEKLHGSERVRYEIFHAVTDEIKNSHSLSELQNRLKTHGVAIDLKYLRGSDEVQGISFTKDNLTFKGSQIDRKYSYKGLLKLIENNNKHQFKHRIPTKLGGISLTSEQRITLDNGKSVYLENIVDRKGATYNAWAKWSEDENKLNFYRRDPDQTQPSSKQEHTHQTDTVLGGGLGLFDLPTANGDDPEEDAFRRAMQQKKKRGRRV